MHKVGVFWHGGCIRRFGGSFRLVIQKNYVMRVAFINFKFKRYKMVHNKTLAVTALMLGLSAGAANAHEIPAITAGDGFTITEGVITWNGSEGQSLNNNLVDRNVLGYHFDVTTAGSLDIFTSDHDDPNSFGFLYVYKKDDVGNDWTLVAHNYEGDRGPGGFTTPTNLFGVHITGWQNAVDAGISDSGMRANFDAGSYLALTVGSQGFVTGHDPMGGDGTLHYNPEGEKLSTGFTWSYLGEPCETSGICSGVPGLSDFYIKASPGSLAVAGPTVEPPPATVPVPGAVWLMGSVLAGFTAFGRKKAVVAA